MMDGFPLKGDISRPILQRHRFTLPYLLSAPRAGASFECRDESADDKGTPDEGLAKENSVLYLSEALGLATMVLWLYCLFDAITTPEEACRNLPKILWVLVVLLFPLVGS